MKTVTLRSCVSDEGLLKLEVPDLPPGPVEVVVVVQPAHSGQRPDWEKLYGLGKEVWNGIDPVEYLRDLRSDRERHL